MKCIQSRTDQEDEHFRSPIKAPEKQSPVSGCYCVATGFYLRKRGRDRDICLPAS